MVVIFLIPVYNRRMAKRSSVFECSNCGHREPKWLGQCPACEQWNTLEERAVSARGGDARGGAPGAIRRSVAFEEVAGSEHSRLSSGIGELDRALGGGLVPGSTVLIGGEPGIGKSTLMLQLAGASPAKTVLYVSGEENAAQIRRRAERLRVLEALPRERLSLLCTTSLNDVADELALLKPRVVIVDSVQTLVAPDAGAVPER